MLTIGHGVATRWVICNTFWQISVGDMKIWEVSKTHVDRWMGPNSDSLEKRPVHGPFIGKAIELFDQ